MRKLLLALALGIAAVFAVGAPANAGVDDFSYDSWHVDYRISSDDRGRAHADVTETLVPRFPDFDQNRGIVRALPLRYEGAAAGPQNVSVTDERGAPVPFELEEDNGFRAILVGDDSFVHGVQHYVIRYTLDDVILHADDGSRDEFYWDILPLERQQDIAEFSARIAFAPGLAEALNGDASCYTGAAGGTARCELSRPSTDDSGTAYTVAPLPQQAGSGVTVAIGLTPGAVVQPLARRSLPLLDLVPYFLGGGAVAAGMVGLFTTIGLRRRRRRFRGTIVAQYDVPPELPPLIAAPIVSSPSANPVPAEFVHLAVNGATRLEDAGSKHAQPVVRLLDPALAADPLDAAALRALFPSEEPGAAFTVPKQSQSFASRMSGLQSAGSTAARERGYFVKERSRPAQVFGLLALGLAILTGALAVAGAVAQHPVPAIVCAPLAIGAAVLSIFGLARTWVHTPLGAETREYLLGVKEFIRVAEADRIEMLQSYRGAERKADGSVDVIRLYEKLLPYAMLFGYEKSWTKVLEVHYQQEPSLAPVWYAGALASGLDAFSSSISRFTDSLSSSASYTASSSGGSTGGGFSGGGGGGGFSGGR